MSGRKPPTCCVGSSGGSNAVLSLLPSLGGLSINSSAVKLMPAVEEIEGTKRDTPGDLPGPSSAGVTEEEREEIEEEIEEEEGGQGEDLPPDVDEIMDQARRAQFLSDDKTQLRQDKLVEWLRKKNAVWNSYYGEGRDDTSPYYTGWLPPTDRSGGNMTHPMAHYMRPVTDIARQAGWAHPDKPPDSYEKAAGPFLDWLAAECLPSAYAPDVIEGVSYADDIDVFREWISKRFRQRMRALDGNVESIETVKEYGDAAMESWYFKEDPTASQGQKKSRAKRAPKKKATEEADKKKGVMCPKPTGAILFSNVRAFPTWDKEDRLKALIDKLGQASWGNGFTETRLFGPTYSFWKKATQPGFELPTAPTGGKKKTADAKPPGYELYNVKQRIAGWMVYLDLVKTSSALDKGKEVAKEKKKREAPDAAALLMAMQGGGSGPATPPDSKGAVEEMVTKGRQTKEDAAKKRAMETQQKKQASAEKRPRRRLRRRLLQKRQPPGEGSKAMGTSLTLIPMKKKKEEEKEEKKTKKKTKIRCQSTARAPRKETRTLAGTTLTRS